MQSQFALAGPPRRHPFRQSVARARVLERKRRDDGDVKLFLLSFTAFFICFYTFIA
ncbi:MAG: hypothetical protein WDN44_16065 [Sphingomonas sp.]